MLRGNKGAGTGGDIASRRNTEQPADRGKRRRCKQNSPGGGGRLRNGFPDRVRIAADACQRRIRNGSRARLVRPAALKLSLYPGADIRQNLRKRLRTVRI